MKISRKWWKLALTIVAALVALQFGVSLLVRTRRMRSYLTSQLERTFGRPVEVGRFSVQLLPTPELDAEQVTVGKTPPSETNIFCARITWLPDCAGLGCFSDILNLGRFRSAVRA